MHILRYSLCLLLLVTGLAATAAGGDGNNEAPTGLWLTEKKDTVVRIERCGGELCGYITWIHPDEEQVTPDGEPMCGQKVLWGFERSSSKPGLWQGGHIYRADKDKEYSGRLHLRDDGTLRLRGYIGLPFLGKSYTLSRVQESDYPACEATTSNTRGTSNG